MKRNLKRILIVVGVLVVVRFVVPLLLAAWHYSSTTPFREHVRETPTADEVWTPLVRAGTELGRGLPWHSGGGEAPERFGQWTPTVVIAHGDEVLLDLALDVRFEATEVEGWLERGLPSESLGDIAVDATRARLDPDFRAVVVLTLDARSDPPAFGQPRSQLDVFLLAGAGDVEFVAREATEGYPGIGRSLLGGGGFEAPSFLPLLLGFAHPVGGPPAEGLAYHMRVSLSPTWHRVEGGSSGAGYGPWEFGATSKQYSVRMSGEHSGKAPFKHGVLTNSNAEVSVEYTWNGEVW